MPNKKIKTPYVRSPCKDCPFRKDSMQGWLGRDRASEFANDTDSFICHKTSNLKDDLKKQCAGHMILMGDNNVFIRILKARNEKIDLRGKELIFESPDDFIDHHEW